MKRFFKSFHIIKQYKFQARKLSPLQNWHLVKLSLTQPEMLPTGQNSYRHHLTILLLTIELDLLIRYVHPVYRNIWPSMYEVISQWK